MKNLLVASPKQFQKYRDVYSAFASIADRVYPSEYSVVPINWPWVGDEAKEYAFAQKVPINGYLGERIWKINKYSTDPVTELALLIEEEIAAVVALPCNAFGETDATVMQVIEAAQLSGKPLFVWPTTFVVPTTNGVLKMSLEETIAAHTKALAENTVAINGLAAAYTKATNTVLGGTAPAAATGAKGAATTTAAKPVPVADMKKMATELVAKLTKPVYLAWFKETTGLEKVDQLTDAAASVAFMAAAKAKLAEPAGDDDI